MSQVVGRERELAVAEEFLDRASERFEALVFEGEAGIGKTTVWREVIRRAQQRGFRVLSCRPAQAETKLSLSAVADLAEGVPEDVLAGLPEPERLAIDVALLRVGTSRKHLEPRQVATAFRSLLGALSRQGPTLLAIDDVQWLDGASASALEFALRRLEGTAMGCLFARRVAEPVAPVIGQLTTTATASTVTVGPLSIAALHHVLKDRSAYPLTRPVLARIHRTSAGNPLYALEIARALPMRADSAISAVTAVPADLRQLVMRRVRRLPEDTREALLACAALSEPTTSLVDESALAPAEDEEIVSVDDKGRIAFRHPLYASAVYGSASRLRRHAVHARLADVVDDAEERSRHLALSAVAPDEEIACALERGAALSRARGAWESAAELLEHAVRLTPLARPDAAHRRRIDAAEHHSHAGDRPRARTLLEKTLAEGLSRPLRADALRLLGEIAHNDQNQVEALRLFEASLECAEDPRTVVASELGATLVQASMWDFPSATEHVYRGFRHAEATGDTGLIAESMAMCVMLDFLCGKGADWGKLRRALEWEDPDTVVALQRRPSQIAALLLLYVGRHADARERIAELCARTMQRGDESDLAFVLLWFSWLETRSGDFTAAARLAEEGTAIANLTGSESTQAWLLTQRALVCAHRGEADQTREMCAEAEVLAQRFGNGLAPIWIAASRALLALSVGDARAAWQACAPLVPALEQHGIDEPVPLFFLPDALEALIAMGELDRAAALLDVLMRRAGELDREWALATGGRCRGLLLAARGDIEGAATAMEAALVQHDRIEMPFERARTLLAGGVVQRRARHRARAKVMLDEALGEFERLGAALFARRARDELGRAGSRRSGSDQLTVGEMRVAELAATGRTNREIAAALFVSAKTVEANLARVYRKLGIRSRAELGARMATGPREAE